MKACSPQYLEKQDPHQLEHRSLGLSLSTLISSISIAMALSLFSLTSQALPEDNKGRLPLNELRLFAEVFNQIRVTYVEEVDDRTLLENAIKGMLTGLDPHSTYLNKQTFGDLKVNTTGEFGGLGLEVGIEDGYVKVIAPIDDTPAQKAGIEAGDLIIKLDGELVKGMNLSEAVKKMRGPRGSDIILTIVREGIMQPFDITITRDIVKVVSVRSRELEPGYGYIRIAQFQTGTSKNVVKAINKLQKEQVPKNALKGIVLDLRNNPGGILQSSVDVADLFLSQGLIVYTEGRLKYSKVKYHATPSDITNGLPIVVLVNGGSASASEIVAGALQDHKRAIIMGTDSFGKGSVQTVVPLSEERAIKLTTALYFTPNGRSIQAQGISPDIEVERARITKITKGSSITEADLKGHLNNAKGGEENNSKKRATQNGGEKDYGDNQIYEALNLLKGIHVLGLNKQESKQASTSVVN